MCESNYVQINPVKSVKRHRVELAVSTPFIAEEDIDKILDVDDCSGGLSSYLHQAIISVMFYTGIRQGELRDLKFENLANRRNRTCLVHEGKGGKEAIRFLGGFALEALEEYVKRCKEFIYKSGGEVYRYSFMPEDYIFRPTRFGRNSEKTLNKKLSPTTVRKIFKKYQKLAELDYEISPHSSRASMATLLHKKGKSLEEIRGFLNHSSVNMASAYIEKEQELNSFIDDIF